MMMVLNGDNDDDNYGDIDDEAEDSECNLKQKEYLFQILKANLCDWNLCVQYIS